MRDSYHICGDTIKTYYNKVCCFYWHYYYLDATIRLIITKLLPILVDTN